eukprot:gb/GECH01014325.1/.p1 GENE.gb/GECH01014325.1/~~gb/GECH01014325.1/.p1  ORF type:complete len:972 (+),score=309.36 gb/GECH01014325.1/:1-2916(+)
MAPPKDLSTMPKTYSPMDVEKGWYKWWNESGFFQADAEETDKPKFVMMLPPPNVTGSLHIGHALTCSIQDTIVRWKRMNGFNTLWLPGIDHAGIATQVVVEKRLMKERGISRHDIGREAFIDEVWKWKNEYGNRIHNQLHRTAASLDWSREVFTMGDNLSNAVQESFIRLFENGTIYRDSRIVNWCCTLKTAISNIEVDHIEIKGSKKINVPGYDKKIEFGVLVSFAYPVEDSDEKIIISTTRIETMLGDVAVAVHPDDKRYTHLHGKNLVHPFNHRKIPIITDSELVDPEFGTGAVKITPAHDPNDFECGKRHQLEFINILNDDGTMNENAAPYQGMKRFDVRYKIIDDLKEKGLYEGKEDHEYSIGLCSRSKDVIEPVLKPQWFCDCKDAAEKAVKAVENDELKILPSFHKTKWYNWLNNIHDWCISRQLWWGHRIPAYFVKIEGQEDQSDALNSQYWVASRSEEEAIDKAAKKFNVDPSKVKVSQDEDVLDTWYSSGLFPFSTLGWPNETSDLSTFYPGNLLETGHDILFFWVARMVMFAIMLTDKLPFRDVVLHAMVRDKMGRKMSKALGNVIDPIFVIEGISLSDLHDTLYKGNLAETEIEKAKKGQKEQFPQGIPECGADALRFALLAYTTQGRDINLDILRVVGYRNFCNKIWNAVKFGLMNLEGYEPSELLPGVSGEFGLSFSDRWILSKLSKAAANVDKAMEAYDFSSATTYVHQFWLYELCDQYLELLKPVMSGDNEKAKIAAKQTLYICLEWGLRLLHPFMPFVTEELWQRLPGASMRPESIMIAEYPPYVEQWSNEDIERNMDLLLNLIHKTRSIKGAYNLTKAQKPALYVVTRDESLVDFLNEQRSIVQTLSLTGDIEVLCDQDPPTGCAVEVVNQHVDVHLMLKGNIDVAAELKKLDKKKGKLEKAINGIEKKIDTSKYQEKVPESVKQKDLEKLEAQKVELQSVEKAKEAIAALDN